MINRLFRHLRFAVAVATVLPLALCTGCIVYLGLAGETDAPLAEPRSPPEPPDLSARFAAYRDFAVKADPGPFEESVRATDMGAAGVPLGVGTYPLRAIAGRGLRTLVERHFRAPREGERVIAEIVTRPKVLSVKKDGETARVTFSVAIGVVRLDESRTSLFDEKAYTAKRTGRWVPGKVPRAVYEALDDIWSAFLEDFLREVPPAMLSPPGRSRPKGGEPLLGDLAFASEPVPGGSPRVVGSCSVACNGMEATEAGSWARSRIRVLCAEHLGVPEDRVGVRYDDAKTRYDEDSGAWTFVFSTWARTRMSLQYDSTRRTGRAVVDLGLFGGTAEEAAVAAKEYIVREMNLRAGIYADDAPEAVADIRFGTISTDAERGELVLPFLLVY